MFEYIKPSRANVPTKSRNNPQHGTRRDPRPDPNATRQAARKVARMAWQGIE